MTLEDDVEIDPSGTFKYVLVRLYNKDDSSRLLVRGFAWAEYHDDIYQRTLQEALDAGLDTECLGGGRILHVPEKGELKVYGYSVGFGRADHTLAVELIQKRYPSYSVSWSNEGY